MDNNIQTLNNAQKIIGSFNFQFIIDRLIKVEKWSESEAIVAVQQYRRYLFLRKKYANQTLPPSKDIDEAWHAHILHTKAYREFCRQVFNQTDEQFLDHNPAEDEQSAVQFSQHFKQTQYLYKKEFGEYIYQIRGRSLLRKMLEKIGEMLMAKFPRLMKAVEAN